MNEKMSGGPTPEELKKQEEAALIAQYADMLAFCEQPKSTPEQRDVNVEVAEFEEMIRSFEAAYPLAELHAIVDLTPADADKHPLRYPAKMALIPILNKLDTIGNARVRAPAEKSAELKAAYKRLSQAVGMINSNKVDHTR